MRELKASSSLWMKNTGYFPAFNGWSEGYGSFTCSYMDMGRLIDIRHQQEHHRKNTFEEEYRSLFQESGVVIDECYFP